MNKNEKKNFSGYTDCGNVGKSFMLGGGKSGGHKTDFRLGKRIGGNFVEKSDIGQNYGY